MWLRSIFKKIFSKMTSNPVVPLKMGQPVVVVLGATGTGKSKLAVDLAAKFNGEVISADSMQVYKGLDILTNKISEEEMNGVAHHMISVVDHRTKFDVTNFRNMALPIVESLRKEDKTPVIVGGTNYYIESLIWKILIDKPKGNEMKSASEGKRLKLDEDAEEIARSNEVLTFLMERSGNVEQDDLLPWSNLQIHSALELVDPARAKKLHPNDRRKVIRSLQVYYQTGRTHTELLTEQLKNAGGKSPADGGGTGGMDESPRKAHLGGPLRFDSVICLWIQVPDDLLETRIYDRVDAMIERGLRKELEDHMEFLGPDSNMIFTEGLLQSIGFKEFEDYLRLEPDKRKSDEGDKLFLEGAQRLKLVTRQYARRQLKWIRQRFLRSSRRQVPPVYWLDGSQTDPVDWENNVTSVATQILKAYFSGEVNSPILKERLVPETERPFEDDLLSRSCPDCDNRILLGAEQWRVHLGSYKHKKMAAKKRKLAQAKEQEKSVETGKSDSVNI